MNWIISLAVLTSSAIFIDCKPSESPFDILARSPTCKEGTSWKEDCNACTCVNGHPACTQMACPPYPGRKTDRKKREVAIEDVIKHEVEKYEKCSAGTVWTSNCVQCECGQDGPHCKGIDDCTPGPITAYRTTCKDGDDWMEDCNHCRCANGIPACTRKLCNNHPHFPIIPPTSDNGAQAGQEKIVAKREASTACKPGTVWIKMTDNDEGCAKFTCHDDGSVTSEPHFTREMCPSEPQFIEDDEDQQQQHVSKREAGKKQAFLSYQQSGIV